MRSLVMALFIVSLLDAIMRFAFLLDGVYPRVMSHAKWADAVGFIGYLMLSIACWHALWP